MAERCYFVSELQARKRAVGWRVANEQRAIAEFFTESAALQCARALARLDCASGRNAVVYRVLPLGQIVLKWRCQRVPPALAKSPGLMSVEERRTAVNEALEDQVSGVASPERSSTD